MSEELYHNHFRRLLDIVATLSFIWANWWEIGAKTAMSKIKCFKSDFKYQEEKYKYLLKKNII